MIDPLYINIDKLTLKNTYYRRVIYTIPKYMQIVLMNIPAGEDIPMEVHKNITQSIFIKNGLGIATIGNKYYPLSDGISIVIPPGVPHRIESVGKKPLKLYTIYTPPEHPSNKKQKYKSSK